MMTCEDTVRVPDEDSVQRCKYPMKPRELLQRVVEASAS
jgi:hypothetical protein